MQNIQRGGDPGSAALHYQQQGDPDVLSWKEGLWLATMGGAEALNWQVHMLAGRGQMGQFGVALAAILPPAPCAAC